MAKRRSSKRGRQPGWEVKRDGREARPLRSSGRPQLFSKDGFSAIQHPTRAVQRATMSAAQRLYPTPAKVISQARKASALFNPVGHLITTKVKAPTVCAIRKARREVLHALGIAGRKGLGRNGVQRTASSKISCK